jgi:hypothetical protein
MVAEVAPATANVLIVNVPLAEPAATVALAGTMAAALLLDKVTRTPPAGAGPVRVIVPVEEPPPVTDKGLSDIAETAGGLMFTAAETEPL